MDKLLQLVPLLEYYPPWLQKWVFFLVVAGILTVIPLLYYLPSALNARKEIVHIVFEGKPPFVDKEIIRIGQEPGRWTGYLYRVRVVNKSDKDLLRIKYLKLTDLKLFDGAVFRPWENVAPVVLDWDPMQPKDISPKESILVQFARVYPPDLQRMIDKELTGNLNIPHFRFAASSQRYPMKMASNVPPGKHQFKLTAYFENAPPAEASFEVEWSKEAADIEAMVQEVRIRMLPR